MKQILIAICAMVALTIATGHTLAGDTSSAEHKHGQSAVGSVPTHYNCPMHKDVVTTKPGKCPKCGMAMEKMAMEQHGKTYRCPMHKDITADKEGICPKCKMKLEFVETKEASGGKY